MKRRVMSLDEIRRESDWWDEKGNYFDYDLCRKIYGYEPSIYDLVDVENMDFCKDGVTRYYYFTDKDGRPAVYYKY